MNAAEKKKEAFEQQFFEEMKDTFFFQVHRVQKVLFRQSNKLIVEAGINLQMEQFPILMTVYAMKSLSQREIADITHRDKSSILRSVTALQRKGLLNVQQDDMDKRKNIVTLTEEGRALAAKTRQMLRKAEAAAFANFSADEKLQAVQSVRNIADKLDNH